MDKAVITIIGNGFGGVYTARALLKRGLRVRLIGDDEYFTFVPLLHELATGTLSEEDVYFPIRSFLSCNEHFEIISSKASSVDFNKKEIILENKQNLKYEILVIATGARPRFDIVQGGEHALCLKTITDAESIRSRIISLAGSGKKHLDINVIGGGYTGLELACEIDQLLDRRIKITSKLRLFERGEMPMTQHDPKLAAYLSRRLKRSGIDFHTKSVVEKINEQSVELRGEHFHSDLTILTAGVKQNTEFIPTQYLDQFGNLIVTKHLNLKDHPEVFALGDIIFVDTVGKPPMLAQLAVQQAGIVSRNICAQNRGKALKEYSIRLKGILLSLGTWDAVGRIFGVMVSGRLAWYIWRTVYLFKTPGLRNQLRIAAHWTSYLFKKRAYIPKD